MVGVIGTWAVQSISYGAYSGEMDLREFAKVIAVVDNIVALTKLAEAGLSKGR